MERLTEKIKLEYCLKHCLEENPCTETSGICLCGECSFPEKAYQKLGEYEDLEEQGKLLKLPCAVGDTAYRINKGAKESIVAMKVCEVGAVSLKAGGLVLQIMCRNERDNDEIHYISTDFGKIVFLTHEEAKAALKELWTSNRIKK